MTEDNKPPKIQPTVDMGAIGILILFLLLVFASCTGGLALISDWFKYY